MQALTICQPYAELIARGEKRVENRTWSTPYRGPLAIHAGKSRKWLTTYSPLPDRMDFGAVIAVAWLAACVSKRYVEAPRIGDHRWDWLGHHEHATGPWLWVLENVYRLDEPALCRGKQRLWEWEPPDR